MKRLWILLRTFPARLNAARRGWAFGDCPVCHVPFSAQTIYAVEFPESLNYSPVEGRLVCGKATCQQEARRLNRARWGRSNFDPWPKGLRIEHWLCPNPACHTINNTVETCTKCGHPKPTTPTAA